MFTGLIEDLGTVREFQAGSDQTRLTVATRIPTSELTLGESVAVNGVCLTLVRIGQGTFTADISPETWQRSNLKDLKTGAVVNLERALRLSDRLGGHLVSGHVDCVGRVTVLEKDRNALRIVLALEPKYLRYVVEKGSVCLDGISLTVNEVHSDGFTVVIIPHTLQMTSLTSWRVGTRVNIETDLLAKYLERLLQGGAGGEKGRSGLTLEILANNGFL